MISTPWFDGFDPQRINTGNAEIFVRTGGSRDAPPLLLLHGFPQTHVMWHRVAQQLKDHFFLVMPDLRGYGDSSHASGLPDHSNYSKRAMALDMAEVMTTLGFEQFYLCGHDRGARVSHRLALDFAPRVRRLCLIDIAPTLDMYNRTDMAFATAYYHWFHLIQPSPVPENMIGGNAKSYLHTKLGGWGGRGLQDVEPQALVEYERCFCKPEAIHTACEDYRASASIDLVHDQESRSHGEKIKCDTLVLWGEQGVVQRFFDPLALWQAQCSGTVSGSTLPAGHFIPEQLPDATAEALKAFFG
jgi:haloacetate dehalogenase